MWLEPDSVWASPGAARVNALSVGSIRWIYPLDLSVGLSVDRRQPAECLSHTLSPPSGGGGLD